MATSRNVPATRQQATVSTERTPILQGRVIDPPKTEYVYVQQKGIGSGGGGQSKISYTASNLWNAPKPSNYDVPKPLPRFLGNRQIITYSWIASMILVGFDEWHNLGILPRPARLWDTSIVYGLLAVASIVDVMVPLLNALAIGYTIMLLWQYFNGQGQFASTKGAA